MVGMLNGEGEEVWNRVKTQYPEFTPKLASGYGEPRLRLTEHLRVYVDTWLEAGRRFWEWKRRAPNPSSVFESVLEQTRWGIKPTEDGGAFLLPKRIMYAEWRGDLDSFLKSPHGLAAGRAEVTASSDDPVPFIASWMFTNLVTSPLRDRLGKCERCGRYYLSQGRYVNKRFHSRQCAWRTSAERAVYRRRDTERHRKVAEAKRAIRQLVFDKPDAPDWKAWVANRSGVTHKWLTRALHRGEQGKPGGLVLSKRQLQYVARLKRS
jgi:hypothetical protein